MLVAHPLTGSPPLPVAPHVLAAVAVLLVAVVATRVPAAPRREPPTGARRWLRPEPDEPDALDGAAAPRGADPAVPGEPPIAVPGAADPGGDARPGAAEPGGAARPEPVAGDARPGPAGVAGERSRAGGRGRRRAGAAGGDPWWLWVPLALSTLVFLLLVAEARTGPPEEPLNLAAVTVVHLFWPSLLVASVLVGPWLWRALDPWRLLVALPERLLGGPPGARSGSGGTPPADRDAGSGGVPPSPARAAAPPTLGAGSAAPATPLHTTPAAAPATPPPVTAAVPPATAAVPPSTLPPPAAPAAPAARTAAREPDLGVWPAVVTGGAWALFLALYAVSVEPRALAAFLGAYTVVMVAGSIAVGSARWLRSGHGIGLVVGWAGLLRRGRLVAWSPPRGAAPLLGAVFGGVAFARLRLLRVWGEVATRPDALTWHRAGAVAAVAGGALLAYLAERWARRRGAPGSVAAALVPVVAALAVGAVLRRLMIAAQLAPNLAPGPVGSALRAVTGGGAADLNPFGTAVQQALSFGIVTLGGLAGAWVVARRVRGVRARDPAGFTVYFATFAAALLVVAR